MVLNNGYIWLIMGRLVVYWEYTGQKHGEFIFSTIGWISVLRSGWKRSMVSLTISNDELDDRAGILCYYIP